VIRVVTMRGSVLLSLTLLVLCRPADAALVAHYLLNDNAANTTVADDVGTYTGTASQNTSTMHTTGKVGTGAFSFNGSSDYVSCGSLALPTSAMSFACWCYATGTGGGGWGRLLDDGKVRINIDGSTLAVSCDGGGTVTTVPFSLNTLYHVVFTHNASGVSTTYLNGCVVSQTALGTPSAGGTVYVGNGPSVTRGWAGWLDDVRIYNHELTAAEIGAIYSAGAGSEAAAGQAESISTLPGTHPITWRRRDPWRPTLVEEWDGEEATLRIPRVCRPGPGALVPFGVVSQMTIRSNRSVYQNLTGSTSWAGWVSSTGVTWAEGVTFIRVFRIVNSATSWDEMLGLNDSLRPWPDGSSHTKISLRWQKQAAKSYSTWQVNVGTTVRYTAPAVGADNQTVAMIIRASATGSEVGIQGIAGCEIGSDRVWWLYRDDTPWAGTVYPFIASGGPNSTTYGLGFYGEAGYSPWESRAIGCKVDSGGSDGSANLPSILSLRDGRCVLSWCEFLSTSVSTTTAVKGRVIDTAGALGPIQTLLPAATGGARHGAGVLSQMGNKVVLNYDDATGADGGVMHWVELTIAADGTITYGAEQNFAGITGSENCFFTPMLTTPGGRIYFSYHRGDTFVNYVAYSDNAGTSWTVLTVPSVAATICEASLAWKPDGSLIVWFRNQGTSGGPVYVSTISDCDGASPSVSTPVAAPWYSNRERQMLFNLPNRRLGVIGSVKSFTDTYPVSRSHTGWVELDNDLNAVAYTPILNLGEISGTTYLGTQYAAVGSHLGDMLVLVASRYGSYDYAYSNCVTLFRVPWPVVSDLVAHNNLVAGYAPNQTPLYSLTGGANTLAVDSSHRAYADSRAMLGTAFSESASGRLAGATSTWGNVASPVATAASVNQSGDAYSQINTKIPHTLIATQIGGTGNYYLQVLTHSGASIDAIQTTADGIKTQTDKLNFTSGTPTRVRASAAREGQ
jgi:hypothetical protein